MKTIQNIFKLLLGFGLGVVGFFSADTLASNLALSGPAKLVLLVAGVLPASVAFWLLDGKAKANVQALLRPVPSIVWVWRAIGASVVLIGLFLMLGNKSGLFITFPYAGTVVALTGALIIAFKGR